MVFTLFHEPNFVNYFLPILFGFAILYSIVLLFIIGGGLAKLGTALKEKLNKLYSTAFGGLPVPNNPKKPKKENKTKASETTYSDGAWFFDKDNSSYGSINKLAFGLFFLIGFKLVFPILLTSSQFFALLGEGAILLSSNSELVGPLLFPEAISIIRLFVDGNTAIMPYLMVPERVDLIGPEAFNAIYDKAYLDASSNASCLIQSIDSILANPIYHGIGNNIVVFSESLHHFFCSQINVLFNEVHKQALIDSQSIEQIILVQKGLLRDFVGFAPSHLLDFLVFPDSTYVLEFNPKKGYSFVDAITHQAVA